MDTFQLHGEFIELNQLLKLMGACDTGGQGKQLVAEGRVHVDGKVELRKTCKIRVGQVVRYEDLEFRVEPAIDTGDHREPPDTLT